MSEPEFAPEQERASAPPAERRAFVRVASALLSECRPEGRVHDVSWPGHVHDISRGGVGLIMQHRFRPGTRLEVELRDRGGRFLRTIAARVAHVTAINADGHHAWLLGCAFEEPLEDGEFEELSR